MQTHNMNKPMQLQTPSRPLFREVALQWAQALRADTPDEARLAPLRIACRLNGETMQDATTSDLLFDLQD